MWKIIKEKHPVLYFDATGSIFRDIRNQNKALLYSLVFHDKDSHVNLPLGEFFTTRQTTRSVKKNLETIIQFLKESGNKNFPYVIVTDFSWTLINSVLEGFNQINMIDYLNWSFQLLNNDTYNFKYETLIFICATHFLKLINKDIKKFNIKKDKRVLKTFLFCVTLLQSSRNLNEFDIFLLNIYNLFNQKKLTNSVIVSIKDLRKSCIERKLNHINNIFSHETLFSDEKNKILEFIKLNEKDLNKKHKEDIIKTSPFTKYFDSLLEKYKQTIKRDISVIGNSENPFFSPDLFFLIKKRLYLMPCWTGVLLSYKLNSQQLKRTYLTNNPVENWFGKLKHSILKNYFSNGVVKPGVTEYTVAIYTKLEASYKRFYQKIVQKDLKKFIHLNEKEEEEGWMEKKKNKISRKKGFYFENHPFFGYFDMDMENEIENIVNPEFAGCFNLNETINSQGSLKNKEDFIFQNNKTLNETVENRNISKIVIEPLNSFSDKISEINYQSLKSIEMLDVSEIFCIHLDDTFEEFVDFFRSNQSIIENLISILKLRNLKVYEKNYIVDNNFLDVISSNELNGILNPVIVNPDGNCLYNSISKLFFGNQQYSTLIRITVCLIFLLYENEFKSILEEYYFFDLKNLVQRTIRDKEWGDELSLMAVSMIFERPVYYYSFDHESGKPSCFTINGNYEFENKDPITIALKDNHYVPLFFINEIKELKKPTNFISKYFMKFSEKIKFIKTYFKI